MSQDKINREHCNLMLEQLNAATACNYYAGYRICVLEEMGTKFQEYKELQAKIGLTAEEKQVQCTQQDELASFMEAAQEHHKLLERLHEKSQRKRNEIDQKIASFRKRHGIDAGLS